MLISLHPTITGNPMNSWDLMDFLQSKYSHTVIGHSDPFFSGATAPFRSIPEAGYQYYLEIAQKGMPSNLMVIGNCFGVLTAWESARHFKKAGVDILFCAINPRGWISSTPSSSTGWTDKYPSPLKEVMASYLIAGDSYIPSPMDIDLLIMLGDGADIPNEWIGLCPNREIVRIKGLPHGLTKYRFGGSADITASVIDEFTKTRK